MNADTASNPWAAPAVMFGMGVVIVAGTAAFSLTGRPVGAVVFVACVPFILGWLTRVSPPRASTGEGPPWGVALEHVDLGLFLVTDGTILRANRGAGQMLGCSGDALDAIPFEELVPGWQEVAPGERAALQLASPSGQTLQANGRRVRMGGGRELWLIEASAADAQRETELLRINEELMAARDEAVEAIRAKNAFLANMSHELRTPLTAIIGYGEFLEDAVEEQELDEEIAEDVGKILTSGRHLLDLINRVLDMAKIEAGKMSVVLSPLDVSPILREVGDMGTMLANKTGSTFALEIPPELPTVRADGMRLRQILTNLIGNACKFTEAGHIVVEALSNEPGTLDIRVRDTGIGMSEDQLTRLFRPFSQGDSSSRRKFGGTGLGLALSMKFARMMGGDILVESEQGKGSVFTLRLHNTEARSAERKAVSRALPTHKYQGDVLIINDESAARTLLRDELEQLGLSVDEADGGHVGVQQAAASPPDLIVLDTHMPGIDGWSALAAIRDVQGLQDVPVVFATAAPKKGLVWTLGAIDYFNKPVGRERLGALITARKPKGIVWISTSDDDDSALVRQTLEATGAPVIRCGPQEARIEEGGLVVLDLSTPEPARFDVADTCRDRSIDLVVVLAPQDESQLKRLNLAVDTRTLTRGSSAKEAAKAIALALPQP